MQQRRCTDQLADLSRREPRCALDGAHAPSPSPLPTLAAPCWLATGDVAGWEATRWPAPFFVIQPYTVKEQRAPFVARMVIGALLILESLVLLVVAGFIAIIGGLAGALSFLAGAGSATPEQVTQGFTIIALTLATPFVMTAIIGAGGFLLLLGRWRVAIVAAGVLAIAAQVALHLLTEEGFQLLEVVPIVLHLATITAGLAFVPVPAASATKT
jgi:hypothetical protein